MCVEWGVGKVDECVGVDWDELEIVLNCEVVGECGDGGEKMSE